MKKIFATVLSLAMMVSMSATAFAADDYTVTFDTNIVDTTADLTTATLVFNLEVPTSLPITVDSSGKVEVSTECKITNNSGGMVKVTDVTLDTTDSEWTIVGYDTDFSKEKVGLTQFGITLNSDEVDTDGSLSLGDNWVSLYANGGTLDIDYEVNVASQSSSLELSIATVEFTLDWDSVEEVQTYTLSFDTSSGSSTFVYGIEGEGEYKAGELVTLTISELDTIPSDTGMPDDFAYAYFADEFGIAIDLESADLDEMGFGTITFYMPATNLVISYT